MEKITTYLNLMDTVEKNIIVSDVMDSSKKSYLYHLGRIKGSIEKYHLSPIKNTITSKVFAVIQELYLKQKDGNIYIVIWKKMKDILNTNGKKCNLIIQKKPKEIISKTFSMEDVEEIRSSFNKLRNRCIFELLYSSGIRPFELFPLNKTDLNYKNNSFIVLGKGEKYRKVYFSHKAGQLIKDYLESRTDLYQCLFYSQKDGRLSIKGIQNAMKKVGITPTQIRKAFATHNPIIAELISLKNRMGHSTFSTLHHYIDEAQA